MRSAPVRLRIVLSLSLLLPLLVSPGPGSAQTPPPSIDGEIGALVAEISSDSLRVSIDALQGFFTRHTNSDTLSGTTGIGAARRWVFQRFQEISAANGGNLQVGYHDFEATIDGISKIHRNVVAELPGADPGTAERVFVVSGHLDTRNEDGSDSTGYAPGANDDGSGIAAAIELARVMAGSTFEATIRFIAFTGEEQGLFGSSVYAEEMAAAGERLEGTLNNDMIGNVVYGEVGVGDSLDIDSTHVRMFSVGPAESSSRQMARSVKIYGDAYVPAMSVTLIPAQDRPGRGGDHISFNNEGFTAVRLVDTFDNMLHQHGDGDSVGAMNFPYFARNVGINLSTLGNLARAPLPVEGLVVGNTGDSTGFDVTWSANPEADLSGYRLTTRRPGELAYESAIDLGSVLSHTLSPALAESVYIGIAAYDSDGHLGLATEALGILSSIPFAPTGLRATPGTTKIRLAWDGAPEGDFSHHDVYRSEDPGGPFAQVNTSPVTVPGWDDENGASGVFYYYHVTTVDTSGNEGPPSEVVRGRVVTLDGGILFVDETEDGPGLPHRPTDGVSDVFYAAVLESVSHDVVDYDSAVAATGITLSDLGAYSAVIWVSDDRNLEVSGIPVITQFMGENMEALGAYLDLGGKVLVMGWRPVGGINENYPVTFGPGDFLYDYFRIETTRSTGAERFFYGTAGASGYPGVIVDTAKTRGAWEGKLPDGEYVTAEAPGAETISTFLSSVPDSVFHGAPVGLRYDGGHFKTQYLGFPLYHLRLEDARLLMDEALAWFAGASTGVADGSGGSSASSLPVALRVSPNPLSRTGTAFRFTLPRVAEVELAVYSVAGRRVRLLDRGRRLPGPHTVSWDGRNDAGEEAASGVYLYRLTAGKDRITGRLVLLR